MNEYIEVRLRKGNKPLRVRRQVPNGIELEETDPIQRSVYLGFSAADEVTDYRMRRISQVKDWEPGTFKLTMSVEDGTIVFRGVDQFSLPEGRYRVRVQLEEAKCRQQTSIVSIAHDGHAVMTIDVELDERTVAVDVKDCDPMIRRVLEASTFEDQDAITWLAGDHRAVRKACLLNLLASLRVRPTVSDPLIANVQRVFWSTSDRAYARVDRDLLTRVEALALHPTKLFYEEGPPKSAVHQRLLEQLPEPPESKVLFTAANLRSYRGEGRPSLQMVLVKPPAGFSHTYGDFDLDLGNPLQDVLGLVIHVGELADKKPTNHLDLRAQLAKTPARGFLYYTVTA